MKFSPNSPFDDSDEPRSLLPKCTTARVLPRNTITWLEAII
jgi:hypothetical protein